jgi:Alginate lyase
MRNALLLLMYLSLSAALWPVKANGQFFALISDSAARAIRGKANTPAGQATLTSANAYLNRSPNPLPTLHIAGKLPGDPEYVKSQQAAVDLPAMTDLALAYRLSGDRKFLDAATRFIKAWASTYNTALNPIDDQDLYYFFVANDLVNSDLPSDVKALAESFCKRFAQSYVDEVEKAPLPGSPAADPRNRIYEGPNKPDPTRINNFQSHRLKLGALAAFAAGDDELVQRAHAAYERQTAINIRPDGTVIDFEDRDALHYVVYDLEPLLLAGVAAHSHGQDWYHYKSPTGSCLDDAINWLIPYAEGKKDHQEFVNSRVPFDQTRAKAGVKGFSGPWDPKGSVTVFAYASVLNPRYRTILAEIEAHTGANPPKFIQLALE